MITISWEKTKKIEKDLTKKEFIIIPTLFVSIEEEEGEKWRYIGFKWLHKTFAIGMSISSPKDEG
jgi:hypothetical protein